MTSPLEVAKDLFCGCVSGWGQVVSMLPFQNIKIKMQARPQEYNQGYMHAIATTIKEEGFLSLYKGMLFPLIGVGAQVSVQFGIVESLKKYFKVNYADSNGRLSPLYSFYSGIVCGIPSSFIVGPLDHARFKVTLIKEKGIGSVGMAKKILNQHGLSKLYRGFIPTITRECLGLGVYFGVYDLLIEHFKDEKGQVNLLGSLGCGSLSGLSFWASIYPIDFIKTCIQGDSLKNPKYSGNVDCLQKQMARGIGVFYTGFGIMAVRAAVVNAVGWASFQLAKRGVY